MSEKRVILFDLGRVLIDFDHRLAVEKISKHCAITEEEIYALFFDSCLTDRYERGKITSLQFFQELKSLLTLSLGYEEFVPIWNEIFTPHPGMLEMLEGLKERHDLYMVSNINELHYQYLAETFPEYFNCFRHLFLSYELKMRKPDEEIYSFILSFLKLPARQVIYIDDRPELVAAARRLLFDAFVFVSTEDCRQQLEKRSIGFSAPLFLNGADVVKNHGH